MAQPITASMLYNYVQCPHRVSMDAFADPADKDPASKFVQLLWERGTLYEKEVVETLDVPCLDLSALSPDEREAETRTALRTGHPLIYQGRLQADDLLGEPDLLRKEASGYVAGDIKSGAGEEAASDDASDGKPKRHYAVQLALYTDLLERMGHSQRERRAFVWDVHGDEVDYDFTIPQGPRTPETLWEFYQNALAEVRLLVSQPRQSRPSLGAGCKLCTWRTACKNEVCALDDLTLIPDLGRSKRDEMMPYLPTVHRLASADLGSLIRGKKTVIPGVGPDSLNKLQARARLLVNPDQGAYLTAPLTFPDATTELFFDIEVDTMRDICYLQGFVERFNRDSSTERYVPFIALSPTPQEEERIFRDAYAYIQSKQPCAIYYYSKYERTWWRNLQKRYPAVASHDDIEHMFAQDVAVDLYFDVVCKFTVWPTNDHSIKTLAKFLGFTWRDPSPSGADSIEWYHRWVAEGDDTIKKRILEYNHDDCLATRVVLDGVRQLPVRS